MLRRSLAAVLVAGALSTEARGEPAPQDLTELTLAELAGVEVTTVSRRAQRREDTPAAQHVITGQDLRRLGATTIPQALRLAPGVQVAQIDGNKYAVGIRGFAGRLSRSMLVLVDGRSVYNTLYAGTLWETPDVFFDDVDRVEVVAGPGGALWGANAVNGIVNVITRSTADTRGGLLRGHVGPDERLLSGRWGASLGSTAHYRVWTKLFDRDGGVNSLFPAFDDWRMGRAGARLDWSPSRDSFTLDAAVYRGEIGQVVSIVTMEPPASLPTRDDAALDGGHLLGRWLRSLGDTGDLQVQAYVDVADRDEIHFDEDRRTLDVELTHTRRLGTHHVLAVGAGARHADVATGGIDAYRFDPADRADTILSAFAQHEARFLSDRLRVHAGLKVERNPYSDWELQPSLRALGRVGRHTFWAAASRAVRTPSRTERDVALTGLVDAPSRTFLRVLGNDGFMSEEVRALEAGWRTTMLADRLGFDVTAFHNRYQDLLGLEAAAPFSEGSPARLVIPLVIGNLLDGRSHGVEVAARGQLGRRAGLHAGWSFLRLQLDTRDPGGDRSQEAVEGHSPRHRFHALGWFGLRHDVELSATLRHHTGLPGQDVPAHAELDSRLAWISSRLELAVVGHNLLAPDHVEWGGGVEGPTALRRSVFGQAILRW